MDQVFAKVTASTELIRHLGYPRRMLRRLLVREGIGPGSRVLDIGCGDGSLVRFFDQLGLAATGIERAAERLAALRREHPQLDWKAALPEDASSGESQPFDLIVVRDEAAYAASVLAAEALRTTAGLLAALRPGGTLAFVIRRETAADGGLRSHDGSCYLKHIECFPGECRTSEYPDDFSKDVLRRLVGSPRQPGHVLATLSLPREAVGRTGWLRFAEIAARSRTEDCCAWGAVQGQAAQQRSAA